MKWIKRAAPHLTIILGLMTLTFFCIDRVNTAMAFMTSELSKWVFMALAVLAIFSATLLIGFQWREDARITRWRSRMERADDPSVQRAHDVKPERELTLEEVETYAEK